MTITEQIKTFTLPDNRPLIIAISGYGGSGKSTLAQALQKELGDTDIVCIDSFIIGEDWRRSADWSNYDRDRFSREVLQPAHANKFPLAYQRVPWPGYTEESTMKVAKVAYLIVEGCSIFHPDLLKYYDFKIWVDCPLEEATRRAMWRDRYTHKNEQDYYWQNIWMPNEADFDEKYQPKRMADMVIHTGENDV